MKMTTRFERDKRIIAQLRKDGRASLTHISKSTGISISTLFERLKQLKGQAITKFTCIVDFKRLGLHAHSLAVYRVCKANKKALQKYLHAHPNVNSVYRINFKYDFLVELVFDGLLAQEEFIDKT
ncbi:winged helix-turn-helix transcriptional regulator, partial [Candidatus Poribacteria bacterium]|nr:winged helix-turn-helix transcriptional regulator [Candidatus Poribacteria bacterium]